MDETLNIVYKSFGYFIAFLFYGVLLTWFIGKFKK
jgi:biotin transporter BioY